MQIVNTDSAHIFSPNASFLITERRQTTWHNISIPNYNLSRAPSTKNTSLIIFPGCHCSYCVEKRPRNGILLISPFHILLTLKQRNIMTQ